MHSEINQVDCDWCIDWGEDRRKEVRCPRCNDSRKVPDPKEVICNLCGECTRPLGTFVEQSVHGLENLEVIGGYFSTHLFDLRSYSFSLCEKCLRNIFNQCKVPPLVQEVSLSGFPSINFPSTNTYMYDEKIEYSQDKESHDYRMWCDQGGHHLAYLNKKCNSVKNCCNAAMMPYTQYI